MKEDGRGQIPPLSSTEWIPPLMPCAQFQCPVPPWRWGEKQKTWIHLHSFLFLHKDMLRPHPARCRFVLHELCNCKFAWSDVLQSPTGRGAHLDEDISSGGHWLEWYWKDDSLVSPLSSLGEWHWEDDNSLGPPTILSTASKSGRSLSSRAWSLVITSRFYGLSAPPNSHLSNAAWLLIPYLMC